MRNTRGRERLARATAVIVTGAALLSQGDGLASEGQRRSPIKVPRGSSILLDGKVDKAEWGDALPAGAPDSGAVYLKRDEKYLYVAVRTAEQEGTSVDLYFDPGDANRVLNLHASAKLGEREGSFEHWPEWVWWNNSNWAANVARAASFQPPAFLADEAKEFQIDIKRLKVPHVLLSIDVQSGRAIRLLPIDGVVRYGRRWFDLEL
jgi:hypothetical protein